MRNEFIQFLESKKDSKEFERTVFITGDLGFSVVEPLQKLLGPRFINAGVAEALMASMAAGLAAEGCKVYIYSIVPFATFRCLEQIRNDICYHKLDVTIVGIGAGYGYGTLGPTHHSTEDLAAMAALPNMTVWNPGDLYEAEWCFNQTWTTSGPKYLRLSKGGDKKLPNIGPKNVSPCWEVSSGSDLAVVVTGAILAEAWHALENHPQLKSHVQLLSIPAMKPFPGEILKDYVGGKAVVVLSELNPYGGLFGHVAASLAGTRTKFEAVREAEDEFASIIGSAEMQRKRLRISHADIAELLQSIIGERN